MINDTKSGIFDNEHSGNEAWIRIRILNTLKRTAGLDSTRSASIDNLR